MDDLLMEMRTGSDGDDIFDFILGLFDKNKPMTANDGWYSFCYRGKQ